MDMSTNNQVEQNCFICKKHKGNIIVPGGAIYEDELVYVGHVHWDSEETLFRVIRIHQKSFGHQAR